VGRRGRTLLIAAISAVAIAGCGLGPGRGTSDVTVTVTRAFGTGKVATVTKSKVPGSETVMRMLERSFHVDTRYGGGFVESINGLSGNSSRLDWFYYVNGIEATQGAATTSVHKGDRIWWDLHDWSETDTVPAVVGSFPEPFVHGSGGKRFPTTLECAPDVSSACDRAGKALKAIGVPVASQLLGTGSGQDTLTVVVGTWADLKRVIAAHLIAKGPHASGVYARFASNGRILQLLDPRGRVARALGAGAGLVAATADHSSTPTWLITGTDAEGVAAAAAAMSASRLQDHFALAVQGASDLPVPLRATS
jgi:hypothetical protein